MSLPPAALGRGCASGAPDGAFTIRACIGCGSMAVTLVWLSARAAPSLRRSRRCSWGGGRGVTGLSSPGPSIAGLLVSGTHPLTPTVVVATPPCLESYDLWQARMRCGALFQSVESRAGVPAPLPPASRGYAVAIRAVAASNSAAQVLTASVFLSGGVVPYQLKS